jgi:tape measure domain-containing protein
VATELGTAYVSIVAETAKLEAGIKAALEGGGKHSDLVGKDIGQRISASASKAMKDGWRPDQDLMAGIPNTKLDRIGARIGQVIGKGAVAGLRARQIGVDFGNSFASGAGSVGVGGIMSRWRSDLTGQSNKLGYLAGKALSSGLTAAVGVGVAGAGLALTKGFDRLVVLDTARYKLKGLGKSTQEIADIVQTVTDSVTGTPFALDAAFKTATQAIGSGVKDLKQFMTDVADAAGFAGTDIERMGLIFNQVQAKGKLTGEEMMQLMEAGVPAKSWIEESYNLTSDQFLQMQKDGEITLDMLQKAIQANAGGMAKGLGDTLQGSIDQMQTAIARLGANFLSAIFGGESGDAAEGMKDAIQRITEQLNNLDTWVKTHREEIRDFFTSAADAARSIVGVLGNILNFLKEHPGAIEAVVTAFVAWKGITVVASLATAVGALNTALGLTAASAAAAYAPLAAIAAIAAGGAIGGKTLSDAITDMGPNSEGGKNALNQATAPGMGIPGASRDPIFGSGTPSSGPTGSMQRERRGAGPVDPTGGLLSGPLAAAGASSLKSGDFSSVDEIARSFGLTMTSGYRPPTGATIDGVPASRSYHGSGQAQDYAGTPAQMEAFANYMATNYGGQLKELIFDSPSFSSTVNNGSVTGPFGSFYTQSQAGKHDDHVHVAYDKGGWLQPGTTIAQNNTGKPEAVFTQSQLADMRTAGAMPAAAGATNEAGSSAISSVIDMGGEVINGIIDQAASAVATAASAAATAGSFGSAGPVAGQAAGTAAQFAIGMGTNAAKRGVSYGFDLLGIGVDSLLTQLTPFGQPRFLNSDYTGFIPQQAITGALGNLMSGGAQQAMGVDPNTLQHGMGAGAAPGPMTGLMDSTSMTAPAPMISDANSFLSTQPLAAEAPAPYQPPMFKVDNIYTQDVDALGRELNKQGRLAQMQYTGRPGP